MTLEVVHVAAIGDFLNHISIGRFHFCPNSQHIASIEPIVIDRNGIGHVPHLMIPAGRHKHRFTSFLNDFDELHILFVQQRFVDRKRQVSQVIFKLQFRVWQCEDPFFGASNIRRPAER